MAAPEIRNAREAAESILDELGLRAFVYTVEPKDAGWVLSIDCDTSDGWQTTALPVQAAELSASLGDAAIRRKLQAQWEPHLRACARRDLFHPDSNDDGRIDPNSDAFRDRQDSCKAGD